MEHIKRQKQTIQTVTKGISELMKLPRYAILVASISLVFAIIIFFAINANFYMPLFLSRLPLIDKIILVGTMVGELFKQGFTTLIGALLLIVSILQGLSLTEIGRAHV